MSLPITLNLSSAAYGVYAVEPYVNGGGGIITVDTLYEPNSVNTLNANAEVLFATFFGGEDEDGGNPFFLPIPRVQSSRPLISVRGRLCMTPLVRVVRTTTSMQYAVDTSNQKLTYVPTGKTAKTITFNQTGVAKAGIVFTVLYDDATEDAIGFSILSTADETTSAVVFAGNYPFTSGMNTISTALSEIADVYYSTWTYSETDPESLLMANGYTFTLTLNSYDIENDSITVAVTDFAAVFSMAFKNGLKTAMPVTLCNNSVACLRTGIATTVPTSTYVETVVSPSLTFMPSVVMDVYPFLTLKDISAITPSGYLPLLQGTYVGYDGLYCIRTNSDFEILLTGTSVCNSTRTECLSVPVINVDGSPRTTFTAMLYNDAWLGFYNAAGNAITSTQQPMAFSTPDHYVNLPVLGMYTIRLSATEQYEAALNCSLGNDFSIVLALQITRILSSGGFGSELGVSTAAYRMCTRPWFYNSSHGHNYGKRSGSGSGSSSMISTRHRM